VLLRAVVAVGAISGRPQQLFAPTRRTDNALRHRNVCWSPASLWGSETRSQLRPQWDTGESKATWCCRRGVEYPAV